MRRRRLMRSGRAMGREMRNEENSSDEEGENNEERESDEERDER